jgi:hypothetical protein
MKIRIISLLALTLLATSGMACHHHHHAEGPVDKAKDVVKDVGHDVKEMGHDIKHDLKK